MIHFLAENQTDRDELSRLIRQELEVIPSRESPTARWATTAAGVCIFIVCLFLGVALRQIMSF